MLSAPSVSRSSRHSLIGHRCFCFEPFSFLIPQRLEKIEPDLGMLSQTAISFLLLALLLQSAIAFNSNRSSRRNSKSVAPELRNSFSMLRASPQKKNNRNAEKNKENMFFGFTDKAEQLNGRFAMTFFAVGIYEEFVTGKSIIEQIGFSDHSQQIGGLELAAFFGTLSLVPGIRKWFMQLADRDLPDNSSKI